MFHADQWAGAFIKASGAEAEEAFACLGALSSQVKAVPGALFGYASSQRLEKVLRESAAGTGGGAALEYAVRFIVLLVRKNYFRYADSVLEKIGQRLDAKNGILAVTAESARALDPAFEEELKKKILEKTGASGIKMKCTVVPGLLGGYRLHIGGFYIDASLKGALEKMTAELVQGTRAHASAQAGGL